MDREVPKVLELGLLILDLQLERGLLGKGRGELLLQRCLALLSATVWPARLDAAREMTGSMGRIHSR